MVARGEERDPQVFGVFLSEIKHTNNRPVQMGMGLSCQLLYDVTASL